MKLRPVKYYYREEASGEPQSLQYGLIAEEVAEVMPELVVLNADGEPETVAYQKLPALLLAELQKEHTRRQALERELSETRSQLDTQAAAIKALVDKVERLAN